MPGGLECPFGLETEPASGAPGTASRWWEVLYYPDMQNLEIGNEVAAQGLPEADPTVVLDVETRFMQSYRVDSPVSAGAVVQAVRNGSGDVELFTLGTDGTIWNFYPDPTSQSSYTAVSTGVQASTFG